MKQSNLKKVVLKVTRLDILRSWVGIFMGCAIVASAFVFFLTPYNIIPGGVYGCSIVLHNLFPSWQVGTFGYCFDIPLLLLSMIFLGSKLGAKTLVVALTTPSIMNVLTRLVYPAEALQSLDPALICGGNLDLSNHLMISSIIGGALLGFGGGILVRCGATSGGTDIVAMFMQKYLRIKFSVSLLIADFVIITLGLCVFAYIGAGPKAIITSFYSVMAVFVATMVVARTISGPRDDKMIFIIHDGDKRLHDFIINDLDRTATVVESKGLYSGMAKEMLIMVVNYKHVLNLTKAIKQISPNAFVIVGDGAEAYGEGWKTLPDINDIMPE